jgi:hypothetical protein
MHQQRTIGRLFAATDALLRVKLTNAAGELVTAPPTALDASEIFDVTGRIFAVTELRLAYVFLRRLGMVGDAADEAGRGASEPGR